MNKIFFFALLPVLLFAQQEFRIFPGSVTQTEPVVTVSPENPLLLFASAVTLNTDNGFKSEGVYISTDGGQTWKGSDTAKGNNLANHGGDPGALILPGNKIILTHIGSVFPGLYSHYSTDLGNTWSNAYTISGQQTEDKGSSTSDNFPSSPYYGRTYAAWVNIATNYPVMFSTSSNGGTSWTTQKAINSVPPKRCSGGYIKTGKDGKVYIVWAGMASGFIEDYCGFASSTDAGTTWNVNQNIFDMNGINGTLSSKSNIRVNGLPQIEIDKSNSPRSGWLYIITTEQGLAPAGNDPDIILHRSSDGGATWSNGIRVNQDPLNNGKIQYFPAMDIDEAGGLNIIYYDDRNTSSDSAEVVLARSTDGGDTWNETVISSHRFKPKPIIGGSSNYQGDHIALQYADKKLYAMWMDDYTGIYQIWCKIIPLDINDIKSEHTSVNDFELQQNYPNPFNPETNITYTVKHPASINITVYNSLGQKVKELLNQQKQSGTYTIQFNGTSLPSGVYFYKMKSDNFISVKKMILTK